MDLTIEGKAYINGKLDNCCIGIKDGKITKIKKILKSDNHKNFGNNLILPSGIDIHTHFREPGMTHKEDFSTGSKSAAFGGISCFLDMPNTIPNTTNIKNIKKKIQIASKKSYVDFGFHFGITNNNLTDISEINKYCKGYKIFLGESTNSMNFDSKNLKILNKTNFFNKPVLIHAEDNECLEKNKIIENNLIDHIKARSSDCEKKAIKNIIDSLNLNNLNIHICHISSFDGLNLIKKNRKLTCGITPHHLLIDIENKTKNHSFFKTNPPIRLKEERNKLFNALNKNLIDVIESDHAPHTISEKNNDFHNAPSGIPSIETMFPILLYLVYKGKISLKRIIELLCENPSNMFGVPKGKIETGRDADLLIIDFKNISKVKAKNLHYKCRWTPFEDFKAIFPKHLFIRGEDIIRDGDIIIKKGFGNFIGG